MSDVIEEAWEGWLRGLPLDPTGQLHLEHSSAGIAWLRHSASEWLRGRACLEIELREAGEHPAHAYRVAWGASLPHLHICGRRLLRNGCTAELPCLPCAIRLTDSDWLDDAEG